MDRTLKKAIMSKVIHPLKEIYWISYLIYKTLLQVFVLCALLGAEISARKLQRVHWQGSIEVREVLDD